MSSSDARAPRRSHRTRQLLLLLVLLVTFTVSTAVGASAQEAPEIPLGPQAPTAPIAPEAPQIDDVTGLTVTLDNGGDGLSQTVTTIVLLTVAAFAPIALLLMTSFTRFVIVLSLIRNGIGLQTIPPSQVLIGLAFFLTLFAMGPTLGAVNDAAWQPFVAGEMDLIEAATAAWEPMRDFMLTHVRPEDLRMFLDMAGLEEPANPEEIGATTLVPAFVISELRTAFTIGFVVFVPFLVIDLVTAAVLMSLGMVMLPPVFVSLPLKLLLFVLVDGWSLISRSLVMSVLGA
ncbi:MAG: flagellar type III secretion system pore protein FliP [Nitriliruptoraceae bacterium]|nr:flagellar type III secretion system pore protein FliP [Nitriliruptoraceae bacterium]